MLRDPSLSLRTGNEVKSLFYSRFTIELRQVFLAMKVFQAKNVSFLFKQDLRKGTIYRVLVRYASANTPYQWCLYVSPDHVR